MKMREFSNQDWHGCGGVDSVNPKHNDEPVTVDGHDAEVVMDDNRLHIIYGVGDDDLLDWMLVLPNAVIAGIVVGALVTTFMESDLRLIGFELLR